MNYFAEVGKNGPNPRIHPLLLSLAEVFNESKGSLNISINSISEDDPRVLRSKYYTSPSELPPLDMHFSDDNGVCIF